MTLPKYIYRRMNEQVLWILINYALEHSKGPFQQIEILTNLLSKWSENHILDFQAYYHQIVKKAYHTDLWGAAYVLNDNCTEEDFPLFVNWLILQGQAVFNAAVEDPETLEKWASLRNIDRLFNSDLHLIAARAFREKVGKVPKKLLKKPTCEFQGDPWDDALELIDRVPRLCQKMGWGNEIYEGNWVTDNSIPTPSLHQSGGF